MHSFSSERGSILQVVEALDEESGREEDGKEGVSPRGNPRGVEDEADERLSNPSDEDRENGDAKSGDLPCMRECTCSRRVCRAGGAVPFPHGTPST